MLYQNGTSYIISRFVPETSYESGGKVNKNPAASGCAFRNKSSAERRGAVAGAADSPSKNPGWNQVLPSLKRSLTLHQVHAYVPMAELRWY